MYTSSEFKVRLRTQWHRRLANAGVRLAFAWLASCTDTSEPPFGLVRVEPSIVRASLATPAVVKGTHFYNYAKVRLNDNGNATIARGWNVWVDDVHLPSDQTSRLDETSLSILLPAGLPIGTHDLSVTDPRGESQTLAHALTVVADNATTMPNPAGGATSSGSGGTSSSNIGARSGTAGSPSGGTQAIGRTMGATDGGTAGSPSGGTRAIGGITGATGSSNAGSSSGGTRAVGGVAGTADSSTAGSSSGGAEAGGNPPSCPNGSCDPGESPCSCPSDCQPPACGDTGSPQLCDANDSSLVGCYRFESSTRPGKDDSQYGNHATSTKVNLVSGYDDTSISLGTTSKVLVAKSPSLDVAYVTVEMWVRVDAVPGGTRGGLFDNDAQYGFFVQKSGVLWCSMTTDTGTNAAQTTAVVSLLVWTHVACTYDGAKIQIFINGVEQASAPLTGALSTSGNKGSSIGANSPSGDNLVGLIDDLRIWNVAHSADQVCEAAHACTP